MKIKTLAGLLPFTVGSMDDIHVPLSLSEEPPEESFCESCQRLGVAYD